MENFLDLARRRRSIRSYSPHPVEFEKIMEVIRGASYAPSAGDLQPWQYILITDEGLKRNIVANCPQQHWMHSAPLFIVITCDVGRTYDFYGELADRWCSQSCAAAVQNMLLAAQDIGLGACWVGSFDAENIRDLLRIPDGFRPEAIVALGYGDETPSDKALRPLDHMVFFNAFGGKLESMHAMFRDWGAHFREQKDKAQSRIQKKMAYNGTLDKAKEHATKLKDKLHGFIKGAKKK